MFKIFIVVAAIIAPGQPPAKFAAIVERPFESLDACERERTSHDFVVAAGEMAAELAKKFNDAKVSYDSKCFDFKNKEPVDDGSI